MITLESRVEKVGFGLCTWISVAEKFRLCAEYAQWPQEKANRIVEFVRTLEDAPDVRGLAALASA